MRGKNEKIIQYMQSNKPKVGVGHYLLLVAATIAIINDIKKTQSLNNPNIEGVIIGKSIYDGDIKINDLVKLI